MTEGIRCMWMRGGTSKGGYFLAEDLPGDAAVRDAVLLRVMGSPDARQIDGMGGADPLTSKVAVVRASARAGVDVDYLFLQVAVDRAQVSDGQTCGNILAGVGPFAVERGLVPAQPDQTPVTIYMENTGQTAVAQVATPNGRVSYAGTAQIDGVPGGAAPVPITFRDTAGFACGALLPTGRARDTVDGIDVTLIDNGMPCVILCADALGLSGSEPPNALEADARLRARVEALRQSCGPLMNLGDVTDQTVPKMTLVSPPCGGGAITTRTFIPHRCHKAIGVLGAVSVASACLIEGSVAQDLAHLNPAEAGAAQQRLSVEHPSGQTSVLVTLDSGGGVRQAAVLRSARKLMDGKIFP